MTNRKKSGKVEEQQPSDQLFRTSSNWLKRCINLKSTSASSTYSEDLLPEEIRLGDVRLELSLGRRSLSTVQLLPWRLLHQILLAIDDGVVLVGGFLVEIGSVDEEVCDDSGQESRSDAGGDCALRGVWFVFFGMVIN